MSSRLERSTTNKVIGGVCGGLAEYLQVDATLVRVAFVIAAIVTAGIAILGYIALLLLMPLPGRAAPFVTSAGGAATGEDAAAAGGTERVPATTSDAETAERRRAAFGYFLIAIGVIFMLANVGVFRIVRWDFIWPLVLIALGVLLLAQRVRR